MLGVTCNMPNRDGRFCMMQQSAFHNAALTPYRCKLGSAKRTRLEASRAYPINNLSHRFFEQM